MLLYQKGRFSLEGVSFAVPDGFYVECDPDEVRVNAIAVDGLLLYPSDFACRMEILFQYDCGAPKEELEEFLDDTTVVQLQRELRPITCNGLVGCEAWYGTPEEYYYEARFLVRSGARQHNLCFLMVGENPLDKLLTRPDIAALRSSLRKD